MSSFNRVTLIGRLGKDPEVKTMQSGAKVCNLSLATSETWKAKDTGERREKVEWHKITIFNENLVSVAERFLKKGALVHIEGALETRKWQDQSGQDRYSTEVVLKPYRGELTMLGGQTDADGSAQSKAAAVGPRPAQPPVEDEIPY